VLLASFDESMVVSTFKFLAVIGVGIVDLIRALGNDSFCEKASGAMPGFIGENISIQNSLEKSSMTTNRYS